MQEVKPRRKLIFKLVGAFFLSPAPSVPLSLETRLYGLVLGLQALPCSVCLRVFSSEAKKAAAVSVSKPRSLSARTCARCCFFFISSFKTFVLVGNLVLVRVFWLVHGRNHPHIMEGNTPFSPSFMEGSRNLSVTFHGKKTFDFFLDFCTM